MRQKCASQSRRNKFEGGSFLFFPACGCLLRAQSPSHSMHSRVLQLRAPLLWLLLPLAAGLIAAHLWPQPTMGCWPFLGASLGTALLALRAANRPRWWMPALMLSVGLAEYVMLHSRYPYLHEWSSRPPCEVTVVLEVRRPESTRRGAHHRHRAPAPSRGPMAGHVLHRPASRRLAGPAQPRADDRHDAVRGRRRLGPPVGRLLATRHPVAPATHLGSEVRLTDETTEYAETPEGDPSPSVRKFSVYSVFSVV